MAINICIPTLNRYDLLINTLISAEEGTVTPTAYYVIDNGLNLPVEKIPRYFNSKVYIVKPTHNLGVARSWNWFIDNVSEYIIICNDDVEFFPDTIELLLKGYNKNYIVYPGGIPSANSFSCYLIPKHIPETIGLFDETISPFYAYYEDNDYHFRMKQVGFDLKALPDCRLKHEGSATLHKFSSKEKEIHDKKFRLAQSNYIKKWGGLPGQEKFDKPYNGVTENV